MTDLTDDVLTIRNLRDLLGEARTRNIALARANADLERHNRELEAEIGALNRHIREQDQEIGALNRHNIELRGAVDALLQPAPSELLAKNREEAVRRQNLDKVEHDGT